MSRGGGFPPLGDMDGESADGWMSDANNGEVFVFARSAKVQRSPVSSEVSKPDSEMTEVASEEVDMEIGQLFTPKAGSSRPQVEQKNLDCDRSRVGDLRKKIDELYDYIKGRHNVHQKIRLWVTGLKTGISGVERELQVWKARAEKAEKEVEKIVNVVSESSPNLRTSKRDRDTPGEAEAPKKQKEDSDEKNETEGEGSGWQTIKNKNEKKTDKKRNEEGKNEEKKQEERKKEEEKRKEKKIEEKKKVQQRRKGEALIVELKDGTTYADLLRKVRADPELKELGENVVKTRRTQKGEMLFELKKDPAVKSVAFKQLVEKSLGEEAKVRALSQETVIECRNLDEITTEDELREALKTQCELDVDSQMVIRLRKTYGATQTAVIRLSTIAANKVLEKGKVKVGWSVCQLKVVPRVTKQMERCFKCMGFGHHARNCEGPDRSKLCRKCGGEGHFANDCANPAKCMLCKVQDGNGHVTGGFKCPAYKKAMANQQ